MSLAAMYCAFRRKGRKGVASKKATLVAPLHYKILLHKSNIGAEPEVFKC